MQVVKQYNDAQRQRLLVDRGMTGPMQVAGRGRLDDMDDRLRLEMDYVENYWLWKSADIAALVPAVIRGDGAF